ncbi:hypothetical protein GCM10027425_01410 [Alteromonas gracilis]
MTVREADPFELPEWLGTGEVTWSSTASVLRSAHVPGRLTLADEELACDLLAADLAHPEPVLEDAWRTLVHRSWRHGQVAVLEVDGRLTLAVPGHELGPVAALEAIGRLAKAVGVRPDRFVVALRPA